MYPRVVIAGERSGCGKTTVSLALMNAFSRKGLAVQGFKVGPDYIDTSHYETRTGRKGRNIDLWMTKQEHSLELFRRAADSAQISIIEGVMGLYDGARPSGSASTAHTARFLKSPVILVLDGSGSAESAAACAFELKASAHGLDIAGFILNRALPGGVAEAAKTVARKTGMPFLGFLPDDSRISIGSRHLGLVTASESAPCPSHLAAEAEAASNCLDLERIERIARSAEPLKCADSSLFPASAVAQTVRFAVARDEAFSFYYEDALDLLSEWGCEVAPFSPLEDESLPEGTDAVFIGGGFPELYCAELEDNVPMRNSLRLFSENGGTVYGECGGMMYLGNSITDLNGSRFQMCGALDADFEMRGKLQSLGYREVFAKESAGFFRSGDTAKGHEFHYSRFSGGRADSGFFQVRRSAGGCFESGMRARNTVASYIHLSLPSSGIISRIPHRIRSASGVKV